MDYELGIRLDILAQRIDEMDKKMDILMKAAQMPEPPKPKKG